MNRFPTRREVDEANRWHLRQLSGSSYTFLAMDAPGYDEMDRKISEARMSQLLERLVVPGRIELKVSNSYHIASSLTQSRQVGAQVMLVKVR